MQYDTIEEITLDLALYPARKNDILNDCACKFEYGWFAVAKDGNCAFFTEDGDLGDINGIKWIDKKMVMKPLTKISIPDGIVHINDKAFSKQEYLSCISISDNVKYIGESAFEDCHSLTSIKLSNSITSIDSWTFCACYKLQSLVIPNSVTTIKECAFFDCASLSSISIPDSVNTIEIEAFEYCQKLSRVTIGSGINSIGYKAFNGCNSLEEVIFKGKTINRVRSMRFYPWMIKDPSVIRCEV